jgi:hypothetical protein
VELELSNFAAHRIQHRSKVIRKTKSGQPILPPKSKKFMARELKNQEVQMLKLVLEWEQNNGTVEELVTKCK